MSKPILVTYASRTCSTQGVAEAVADTLAESGAQVEVRAMQDVPDVTRYSSVVAGSAIQGGQWLPEALDFVRTHRVALASRPFATFTVCMTMAMKNPAARAGVSEWLAPVRALVRPLREGYFAGVLTLVKVPSMRQRLMFRAAVAMGVWSEGDHRDWDAIRAWALELKPLLAA